MGKPKVFFKQVLFVADSSFDLDEVLSTSDVLKKSLGLVFDEVNSLSDGDVRSVSRVFNEAVSLGDFVSSDWVFVRDYSEGFVSSDLNVVFPFRLLGLLETLDSVDLVNKYLLTNLLEVNTLDDFLSKQQLLVIYEMTQGFNDAVTGFRFKEFSESAFLDDSLDLSVSFNKSLDEVVDLFDGDVRSVTVGLDESLSSVDVKGLVFPRLDLVDSLGSLDSFVTVRVFNEDFLKSFDLDDSVVKSYDLESDEVKSYDLESEVFKQLNK